MINLAPQQHSPHTPDQTHLLTTTPVVVIAGPPGAGKGTISRRLATRLDLAHLSIGDELRAEVQDRTPLGTRVHGYLEVGRLVPDHEVVDLVTDRLTRHRARSAVLLDGFPRTLAQAEALERTPLSAVKLVVYLVVSHATIFGRLRTRGRADDNRDVVTTRVLHFERDTRPVLAWYASRGLLIHIDANAPPSDVTTNVETYLTEFDVVTEHPQLAVGPEVWAPHR